MIRLSFILFFCFIATILKAQDKPLFIFDEFYPAKVYFKNRSITIAPMNYDAVNDRMYFKEKDELMEVTDYVHIDSIVWARKRCFVPYGKSFIEQVQLEHGKVYIHWRIRNVNLGSKGALGFVTHAKVETINLRNMGVMSAEDGPSSHNADVYQQKNSNEYFMTVNGELKKVVSLKHLYKLFPHNKEKIKEYALRKKIKMKDPYSVLQLLDYCMGL